MSSARIESPLLQELRRQPSPPCASTMPKPRACRKLFPVDQAETNRFLRDQTARFEEEQKREFGFDFERYEPLPDQNSSRYTDWEAIPAERAPSFYHETVASRKPFRQSARPSPTVFTSPSHQSSNNGSIHPGLASTTTVKDIPIETSKVETRRSRSFLPVHPEDNRPAPSPTTNFTSIVSPNPYPNEILEHASGSEEASQSNRDEGCSEPRDNIENTHGSTSTTSSSSCELGTNTPRPTQSKITDFMRRRKRNGSGSSSVSCVSSAESGAEGEKHHQVSTKRRRSGSSGDVSSLVTGYS